MSLAKVLARVEQGFWRPEWVDPQEGTECGCLIQLLVREDAIGAASSWFSRTNQLLMIVRDLYPEDGQTGLTNWNDAYATQGKVIAVLQEAIRREEAIRADTQS